MTKKSEVNKIMSALAGRSELVKSAWTMYDGLPTDISDVRKDLRALNQLVDSLLTHVGGAADSQVDLRGDWDSFLREIGSVIDAATSIDREYNSPVKSRIEDKTYAMLTSQARQISSSIESYNDKWQAIMFATNKANQASGRPSNTAMDKIKSLGEDIASGLLDIEKSLKRLQFTKQNGDLIGIYSGPATAAQPALSKEEKERAPGPWAPAESPAETSDSELIPSKIKTDYMGLRQTMKQILDAADFSHEDDPKLAEIVEKFAADPAIKRLFKANDWIVAQEKENVSDDDLLENHKIVLEKMQKFYPAAKAAVDKLKQEVDALDG